MFNLFLDGDGKPQRVAVGNLNELVTLDNIKEVRGSGTQVQGCQGGLSASAYVLMWGNIVDWVCQYDWWCVLHKPGVLNMSIPVYFVPQTTGTTVQRYHRHQSAALAAADWRSADGEPAARLQRGAAAAGGLPLR